MIQPHPYFNIKPLNGVVPANGSVNINISFNPITLGTCTSVIRLFIAEHNFKPIETVINARAVSGLIEQKAIRQVEERISDLLTNKTFDMTQKFGDTFLGSPLPSANHTSKRSPRTTKLKSKYDQYGEKSRDPVGAVLKKTFCADGVEPTLKSALLRPADDGTLLLGSKVPAAIESGPLKGTKKVIGNLKSTQPLQPRGIGSGNVFDAGAEYIVAQTRTMHERSLESNAKKNDSNAKEKIVDGLRIPPNLNSTAAVNFVLTQEPGKLKPKDLKIAIERNREERRNQELEQARLREEGGKLAGGGLDLRAILADERLNSEPGDAFKRQLREMAFLTDMEETKKEEVEKTFRVSEEFLGANILSSEDLKRIHDQRHNYRRHRSRTNWRQHLARMQTMSFIPQTEDIRAGAPTPSIQFHQNLLVDSSKTILNSTPPSFDTNKNDIWSKRMNTLRKFVSIVGKWIIRRRVEKRIETLRQRLHSAGVVDRNSAKAFVEVESNSPKNGLSNSQSKASLTSASSQSGILPTQSLATLVCCLPNQALVRKQHSETLQDPIIPTPEMCRRVLFPKYIQDEVSIRKMIPSAPVDSPLTFDDRTFFPLKIRVEYMDLGYERETLTSCPVYFPPISKLNLQPKAGASEENSIRSSAGSGYNSSDIQCLINTGCDQIFSKTKFVSPPILENISTTSTLSMEGNFHDSHPSWLGCEETVPKEEIFGRDLAVSRPEFRIYSPELSCRETCPDWILQPYSNFEYDTPSTLRTRFLTILYIYKFIRMLETPGFHAAQCYLLASYTSRIADSLPPLGPTIADFYLPDADLHASGLSSFSTDYHQSIHALDSDIPSLQEKLMSEDYLTESESDNDDDYQVPKPSLDKVKEILCSSFSTQLSEPLSKKVSIPTPQTPTADAFSVLDEANRKVEQVELMRDRKSLELSTHLRQIVESKMNQFSNRFVLFIHFGLTLII